MYYIQTFKQLNKTDRKEKNGLATVGRFLDPDYMGSAEFEFGAVPRSWFDLISTLPNIHRIELDLKASAASKKVPMFVMAADNLIEGITVELNKHLDGDRIGKLTKDYSGIWDTANTKYGKGSTRAWGLVDLWLDVSNYTHTNRHIGRTSVFSLDLGLLVRVYLELLRAKLLKEKASEVSIGDMVYVARDEKIVEAKVAGINEGDTLTLKYFHNRMVVSVFDVLAIKDVQDNSFVKMIEELDKSKPVIELT